MRTPVSLGSILAFALAAGALPSACGDSSSGNFDAGGNGPDGNGPDGKNDAGIQGCQNAPGQIFPPGATWNTAVDSALLDAESAAIISKLEANHTGPARFQIDFSLTLLVADSSTRRQSFNQTNDFFSPDCDPAPVPVPAGGSIEGEDGYECTTDGDCHLLVLETDECRLYEMWRADIAGGVFNGGCLAIWDVSQVPRADGRGDHCVSADAAGLPIAPLLFTADEIAAGEIDHAIRFTLPNALIRDGIYVRPGTHSTSATAGGLDAPPYAARIRLRQEVDISDLGPAAQVVARALKKYGMFLADGRSITFTAASDRTTTNSWADVGLGPRDLQALSWSDFEVPELGQRYEWISGRCDRSPITN